MRTAVVFAFFAFILLSSAAASEAAGPTYREESHHSYALSGSGTVTINDVEGTIRVIGWNKNVAQVDAFKCAPTPDDLKNLTVVINSAPSSLKVNSIFPPSHEEWFSWTRLLGVSTRCNQGPEIDYVVHVPDHARVALTSASADSTVIGPIGSLRAGSASGNVSVTGASDITIETQSGDVTLSQVRGVMAVTTSSGETTFNDAKGDITVNAASGAVGLYRVSGKAVVNTSSGDITARSFGGLARLNSNSGDVSVTLVRGGNVTLSADTVSGDLSCDVPRRERAPIQVHTISGDIAVNWI